MEYRAGISLMEIIVVIGIFAVLAASVSFFPAGFFREKSLGDDAVKIAFTLRSARNRAVAQESGSKWGVHFVNNASGGDYYQVFKGDAFASGTIVERINLNESVQFVSPASAASIDVLFEKMSGLPPGASTIIISLIGDPTKTKTITIFGNGQVDY